MDHREGQYKVRDLSLADEGRRRIDWAESRMPVMMALRERYAESRPLEGYRIAGCLHVTKETAVLIRTLRAAGAEIAWSGCNPLSTNDAVAAALADEGVKMYAWHGLNTEEFYWCIDQTLAINPNLTLDDGADLIFTVHNRFPELCDTIIGGTEETTTGVHRLRAMADDGALRYPVIAVNDAETKHFFDNRYGTGQSTLDGILRATNILIAGKVMVVAGYGWCGKGIAMRARGMGARVVVTEINPTKALEAAMDGFAVTTMPRAAQLGDIFVTATGNINVIDRDDFERMRDGAIVANAGHFNSEINMAALQEMAGEGRRELRPYVEEFQIAADKNVVVLGDGRLINLAAAEGHPASVMDMSFANQALACSYLVQSGGTLANQVYTVPEEIDQSIAGLKLASMGIEIDELTDEQLNYLESWEQGT